MVARITVASMPNQDPVIGEFRANGGHKGGYFETIPLLVVKKGADSVDDQLPNF
jgi:hypothetical protein